MAATHGAKASAAPTYCTQPISALTRPAASQARASTVASACVAAAKRMAQARTASRPMASARTSAPGIAPTGHRPTATTSKKRPPSTVRSDPGTCVGRPVSASAAAQAQLTSRGTTLFVGPRAKGWSQGRVRSRKMTAVVMAPFLAFVAPMSGDRLSSMSRPVHVTPEINVETCRIKAIASRAAGDTFHLPCCANCRRSGRRSLARARHE